MSLNQLVKNFFLALGVVSLASIVWVQLHVSPRDLLYSAPVIDWGKKELTSAYNTNDTSTLKVHMNRSQSFVISAAENDTSEDVFVHLLSYQRSGSSFMGGVFHSNPDAFFIYEPIDMIYSAMFGVEPGWASPADIFMNRNGTLRNLPMGEVKIMQYMMEEIYHCNISSLPMAVLTHPFWDTFVRMGWMPTSKKYSECLQKRNLTLRGMVLHNKCRVHIRTLCPRRFDPTGKNLDQCQRVLWNNGRWYSNESEVASVFGKRFVKHFQDYFACQTRLERVTRRCAQVELDTPCRACSMKVIKTVRATMEVAENLIRDNANAKLIHLVRDPRGVAKSRAGSSWSWGIREGKQAGDRARPYCIRAGDDAEKFNQMAPSISGRSMRLIYDEMLANSTRFVNFVYEFLGREMPTPTKKYLAKNTKAKVRVSKDKSSGNVTKTTTNYINYAVAWKSFFTLSQVREIRNVCRSFYEAVLYNWL